MNQEIIIEVRRHLGFCLKDKRLVLGLNKAETSRRSGLTREQILRIEDGTWSYTVDSLIKLADILELSVNLEQL